MANIIKRPGWHIPERLVTPESIFLDRRRFLRQMGFAGAGLMSTCIGCSKTAGDTGASDKTAAKTDAAGSNPAISTKGYPAPRNPDFNPGWPLTNEKIAAHYNNFYEFSTTKSRVSELVDKLVTSPWPVEIGGLVEKPMTLDAQELAGMMTPEERVYRFRCVEAWAMIVPWTGFPLSKLIEKVSLKPAAKFIKFTTFNRTE